MKKSTRPSTRAKAFVDTSGFYALLVKDDRMHARAGQLLECAAKSTGRFVTTDYVLDETATLLNARGHGRLAEAFFQSVFASRACRIEWMDPDRFAQTRQFFLKHHDKSWSFTDCFSFLVMHDLTLRDCADDRCSLPPGGLQPAPGLTMPTPRDQRFRAFSRISLVRTHRKPTCDMPVSGVQPMRALGR